MPDTDTPSPAPEETEKRGIPDWLSRSMISLLVGSAILLSGFMILQCKRSDKSDPNTVIMSKAELEQIKAQAAEAEAAKAAKKAQEDQFAANELERKKIQDDATAALASKDRQIEQKDEELRSKAAELEKKAATADDEVKRRVELAMEKVEAEKTKLKEELEETRPGEARVVVEPFDPKKHKRLGMNADKIQHFRGQVIPEFDVQSKEEKVKTPDGMTVIRPVLAQNGKPLLDGPKGEGNGDVPVLKDKNMQPYHVKMWWTAVNDYVYIWCAKPKDQ